MADSAQRLVAQTEALELAMYCHAQILKALTQDGQAQNHQQDITPADAREAPDKVEVSYGDPQLAS